MTDNKNYIVLARKYRPKKLSDIIGQEDTCKIIEGSIKLGRLAHAFLFSGTRGVGKTTLARILSKIVNCSNLDIEKTEPCDNCENCKSIDSDSNMDVIEIDAASRTGVSDVREIIDDVNYKPVSAKKKIFIIDEVHMLSKAAFNALLKTLEEPPSDVIFIFATTETEKIPLTILSRCQRFQLKRIEIDKISQYLLKISKKEGFEISEEGCDLISQSSEGSVRDALSILDNVFTRGNPVKIGVVRGVLGLSDNSPVIKLFELLCEGNVKDSLEIFAELYTKGISIQMLGQTLMRLVYHCVRLKAKIDEDSRAIDPKTISSLNEISNKYQMDFLIRFWELMQKYLNEINKYFDEKQCFEMVIMRLCYVSLIPTPFELLKKVDTVNSLNNINDTNSIEKEPASPELKPNSDKNLKDNITNNLAIKNEPKEDIQTENSKNLKSKEVSDLSKFKLLVDEIEKKSEMLISHHLKNSFRLVSLVDNQNVKEIELENISDNQDSKKILWQASKLLNQITKNRWLISLSTKTGAKTLLEYELDLEREKIDKLKKNTFVKKILEIIPSSEVVSIKKIDNNKNSNKRDNNE